MAFRQSLLRFILLLGLPALGTAMWLVDLGAWGLWVFPPSDPWFRINYGYGPLILAGAILLVTAVLGLNQGSVVYRVTPWILYRKVGFRAEESWPLEHVYVARSQGRILAWIQVTDGRRTFRVYRLFMSHFGRFYRVLEAASHARRRDVSSSF